MPRRRSWKWKYALPLGVVAGYAAIESALVQLGHPAPCLFRLLSGIPCPTCGATRATVRLLHGDLLGALEYNPFVTLLLSAIPLAVAVHFALRQAGRPGLTPALTRRPGWLAAAVVAALLANWAYVLRAEHARGGLGKRNPTAAAGNAKGTGRAAAGPAAATQETR